MKISETYDINHDEKLRILGIDNGEDSKYDETSYYTSEDAELRSVIDGKDIKP